MNASRNAGDGAPHLWPVSIKGVVIHEGQVVLLRNERDEWELPGGKLEADEAPEACVVREIEEEVAISSNVGDLLDSWVYHIKPGVTVLIVTYGVYPRPFDRITKSPEHKEARLFSLGEVRDLNMPEGYKRSIFDWKDRIN
jgi:mutator protein MutT